MHILAALFLLLKCNESVFDSSFMPSEYLDVFANLLYSAASMKAAGKNPQGTVIFKWFWKAGLEWSITLLIRELFAMLDHHG